MISYICRCWFIIIIGNHNLDTAAGIQTARNVVWNPYTTTTNFVWWTTTTPAPTNMFSIPPRKIMTESRTISFTEDTESNRYTTIENTFVSVSQADVPVLIKLFAGVTAFLVSIIVVLLVVHKLKKASYTCLTARRDTNIYNETTHHLAAAGHYLDITPLAEMSATGYRPTEQQLIDQIQHVDTSGYLISSSSYHRNEDQYESI